MQARQGHSLEHTPGQALLLGAGPPNLGEAVHRLLQRIGVAVEVVVGVLCSGVRIGVSAMLGLRAHHAARSAVRARRSVALLRVQGTELQALAVPAVLGRCAHHAAHIQRCEHVTQLPC